MKPLVILMIVLAVGISSRAQKMVGFGGELSVLSFKPNVRVWLSRTSGIEVFGGIGAELDDLKPNDPEAGFKYLYAIDYKRQDRTYIGIMGKWKWVDVFDSNISTNLPIPGILIGKEWLSKRINLKGYAVELGYQFGSKEYQIFSPVGHIPINKVLFNEFPLILNFRYSFYYRK